MGSGRHQRALPNRGIRLYLIKLTCASQALPGLHTKSTQCEGGVPPFAAHGHLHNVRQH